MERTRFNSEEIALELFSADSYLPVNKTMLRKFGPDVTIFLSNLIDKFKYFVNKEMTEDGRWFYLIHDQQIEQTGLTLTKIRACKSFLIDLDILQTKRKGVPAKELYLINFDVLLEQLSLKSSYIRTMRTRPQDFVGQDLQKPIGHIIKENKLKENKYDSSDFEKPLNHITQKMFERFWKLYPRKVDKGKALTSWNRICTRKDNRPTWTDVKRAIREQLKTERWSDPKYIPHPTTWLNESRWLDDPKEMTIKKFENDKLPKIKYSDGIGYKLGPDGKYRNSGGEIWID